MIFKKIFFIYFMKGSTLLDLPTQKIIFQWKKKRLHLLSMSEKTIVKLI